MGRVRAALLAVSAVLLLLVGTLAWRAHQGLLAERAMRHRAVAERAFEELERALSEWLEREEARPVEHYAFYLPGGAERTPLVGGLEPFVVGAFQQSADGALRAVGEPRDLGLAGARGDWPPAEDERLAIARVKQTVNSLWSRNASGDLDESDDLGAQRANAPAERQAPGTTRALAGPGVDTRDAEAPEARLAKKESSSAYEVLQSLNRAGADRSDRKQKQVLARVEPSLETKGLLEEAEAYRVDRGADAEIYGEADAYASAPTRELDRLRPSGGVMEGAVLADRAAEPEAAGPSEFSADEVVAVSELAAPQAGAASGFAAPGARVPSRRAAPEAAARPAAPKAAALAKRDRRSVRLTLDPMLGVPVGADTLVLYRTVLAEDRAYRQGLVLDRERLGAWLDAQVIAGSALAPLAQLRFDASASAPPAPDTRYLFAHRFAEPFDALHAELALKALPGEGSPGALLALVAVLLAVGAAGLFAVHRTASVVLHYAERRGNFVAAVTHELKTPLTAIRMYAEMLRDDLVPDDVKRREYYGTITDESERLSRLVDNVLEFSKLEGGRRELRLEVGDVGPLLDEVVGKLATHARREGFELAVELDPGLPPVRFDRDALLQVLYNLVDNAMKYASHAGEKRISIEAREERGGVRLAVRDFGPGVARGHLEHLFEPFYRAESELTRNTKGTGIGLALVKELAERMGAAVSGANAEGGGFRVGLVFPAAQTGGTP